jgi:hypothetical protein
MARAKRHYISNQIWHITQYESLASTHRKWIQTAFVVWGHPLLK